MVLEAIVEHRLEPELLAPTPRRLRLPWRTSLLLSVAALLLSLFVLGSGRALWEGAKMLWLDGAGQTISGKIVAIRTAHSMKGQLPVQTALCYEVDVPSPQGVRQQRGWVALGAPARRWAWKARRRLGLRRVSASASCSRCAALRSLELRSASPGDPAPAAGLPRCCLRAGWCFSSACGCCAGWGAGREAVCICCGRARRLSGRLPISVPKRRTWPATTCAMGMPIARRVGTGKSRSAPTTGASFKSASRSRSCMTLTTPATRDYMR